MYAAQVGYGLLTNSLLASSTLPEALILAGAVRLFTPLKNSPSQFRSYIVLGLPI